MDQWKKYLFRFLGISLFMYILWVLLYEFWLKEQGALDNNLTALVTRNSVVVLNIFGLDANMKQLFGKCIITLNGARLIGIAHPCNGLVLYPIFAGFIIAAPGIPIRKIIMILVGSAGIYIINILRIVLLALIGIKYPEYLNFNHKYTFTLLVYSFIFFLWMLWINKFSGIFDRRDNSLVA